MRVYRFHPTVNAYTRVGSDIDGVAVNDSFGWSLSMSSNGSIFVVGAPYHDWNSTLSNTGQVRVYRFNETTNAYTQMGSSIDGDAAGDLFGWTVSMSADGMTLVVGAPFHDRNSTV